MFGHLKTHHKAADIHVQHLALGNGANTTGQNLIEGASDSALGKRTRAEDDNDAESDTHSSQISSGSAMERHNVRKQKRLNDRIAAHRGGGGKAIVAK